MSKGYVVTVYSVDFEDEEELREYEREMDSAIQLNILSMCEQKGVSLSELDMKYLGTYSGIRER